MLFIPELGGTVPASARINKMSKEGFFVKTGASTQELGQVEGASYSEHIGIILCRSIIDIDYIRFIHPP